MGVQRGEQNIASFVKNILRVIAVVVVDVEDRDAVSPAVAQVLRRQCGVVEKAIAAEQIARRVMPRRAAERKRRMLAALKKRGCSERDIGGDARGLPSPGAD